MLRTLEIRRFRAFEQFSMTGLTRVNLLLGSNNAGKTSVMEAAELLLGRGAPWTLTRSPLRRGDGQSWSTGSAGSVTRPLISIRYLFHGYQLRHGSSFEIWGDGPPRHHLRCELLTARELDSAQEQLPLGESPEMEDSPALDLVATTDGEHGFRLPLRPGGVLHERYPRTHDEDGAPVNFVDTRDPEARLAWMWDQLVLTPKEADAVQALQLVDPTIERLAQLSSFPTSRAQMLVKRSGANEPVPLGTMGDGAKRLLVLSVNLATAAKGYLLVDEIDTGLHYSVLGAMWRLVLATARRLDVQVFASTHSLDGLRALAWALGCDPKYAEDVSVHRIVRNQLKSVRYSANELELAVEQDMEIR